MYATDYYPTVPNHDMPSLLVHVLFIWLLVGVFPLAAVGQAPGDEDPFCKDSRCNVATTYPSNVTILMDSRNYAYLIGGVWDQLERDGDTDVEDICSYNRVSAWYVIWLLVKLNC